MTTAALPALLIPRFREAPRLAERRARGGEGAAPAPPALPGPPRGAERLRRAPAPAEGAEPGLRRLRLRLRRASGGAGTAARPGPGAPAAPGYAMTGFRLPISTFRKLNVWFGLWEKLPSNKLYPTWRRSLFCSCQASTVNYRRCFSFSPVRLSALRLSPEYISVISLRNKSSKSSKRSRQSVQEEEEEEDEDESNLEDEFENDPNVVKDYKDLEKVVQSLRYDVILKAGLDMARNKVEDAFYNNELRLNGEKLWKKSRTVKLGDTLDLIIGEDKETGTAVVMRVVLKKLSDKTESEKYKVILRRWKNLKVPKQDVLK